MSDLQILIEMGFSEERAAKALEVTNNKGFEPAMEWLLAHVDELNAAGQGQSAQPAQPAANVAATAASSAESAQEPTDNEAATPESGAAGEAKSLKCDDCNRLFKTQAEVEFHAAKTNHKSFSESTEEKPPLTEDEKKEQMSKLDEKLRRKRTEREEREKEEARERERIRIKSGKDISEAQRKMEEMEMKKLVEQRKREKQEEQLARSRVRAQIELDKAARRERMQAETGKTVTSPTAPTASPVVAAASAASPRAPVNYTHARIQVRLQDGTALQETFDAKEQLAAVRLFVRLKLPNDTPFTLMTTFPRKVFTEDDYEKPLEALGLVPSAVLTVAKPT